MTIQMTTLDSQLVLQIAGILDAASLSQLEAYWQAARAQMPHRKISVDLTCVTRIDQAGWGLLRSMRRAGVDFLRAALAKNKLWSLRKAAAEAGTPALHSVVQ